MNDRDHPFLRPLWRRLLLIAICVAWAIWEFFYGQQFWGMLAAGMAAYGIWMFLITYKQPQAGTDAKKE